MRTKKRILFQNVKKTDKNQILRKFALTVTVKSRIHNKWLKLKILTHNSASFAEKRLLRWISPYSNRFWKAVFGETGAAVSFKFLFCVFFFFGLCGTLQQIASAERCFRWTQDNSTLTLPIPVKAWGNNDESAWCWEHECKSHTRLIVFFIPCSTNIVQLYQCFIRGIILKPPTQPVVKGNGPPRLQPISGEEVPIFRVE